MGREASSSNESVASVGVNGADLRVGAKFPSEGTAWIILKATDHFGLAAMVRFQVQEKFHWPSSAVRGWRATLRNSAEDAEPKAR